jgi:hypothetical protein
MATEMVEVRDEINMEIVEEVFTMNAVFKLEYMEYGCNRLGYRHQLQLRKAIKKLILEHFRLAGLEDNKESA